MSSMISLTPFYRRCCNPIFVLTASWLMCMKMIPSVDASQSSTSISTEKLCRSNELIQEHPILCHMLNRLVQDGDSLAQEMTSWAKEHGLLVGNDWEDHYHLRNHDDDHGNDSPKVRVSVEASSSSLLQQQQKQLPVVFAHGMGDSCFNRGMQHIVNYTSQLLGNVYTTCIPIGKDQSEDTSNGYFMNMDASVDIFADSVAQDPNLFQGFHAIGFSQGNNIIRGYIARYNEPTVHTFLSVNGVNAGVGAVPHCPPSSSTKTRIDFAVEDAVVTKTNDSDGLAVGGICDLLMEQASRRAYTEWAQEHSFQANYWRDPRPIEKKNYQKFSQLARWNNEGPPFNQTLKDNYAKTTKFVWVMATQDTMVWPAEGEHWGAPDPDAPLKRVLPMNQTEWYLKDLFGLKTAQEAGKNYFETFEGDHLQFTEEDFARWVQTYMAAALPEAIVTA